MRGKQSKALTELGNATTTYQQRDIYSTKLPFSIIFLSKNARQLMMREFI